MSRKVDAQQLQLDETPPEQEHVNEEAPPLNPAADTSPHRSSAADLLETPGALLTRTHLRELGLERRAIDAVFRALPVVALPGYSRPLVPGPRIAPCAARMGNRFAQRHARAGAADPGSASPRLGASRIRLEVCCPGLAGESVLLDLEHHGGRLLARLDTMGGYLAHISSRLTVLLWIVILGAILRVFLGMSIR